MDISLKAQHLFNIGSFNVTNSLLLTWVVLLILIIFSIVFKTKIKMAPGKVQGAVEMLMEYFLDLMNSTLESAKEAEKFFPLILTIFIFILMSNLLGLLPGVGVLTYNNGSSYVPLLRSPAADLNFTLAFAIMAVVVTNFFGIIAVGISIHIKKFLNFSSPMNFIVGILESVSELTKIISFSFRLFGTIFAGEVLLTVVFFLLPYVAPLPFFLLEIFFGIIQAFIFAMLTLVFLVLHRTKPEH